MDLIRKIAKRELLSETAGISFIVRKWATVWLGLKQAGGQMGSGAPSD